MKITGSDLFVLRKKGGFSQQQLADKMHVDKKTIRNWEKEVTTPNFNQVCRLCVICNISALWLLTSLALRKDTTEPLEIDSAERESN